VTPQPQDRPLQLGLMLLEAELQPRWTGEARRLRPVSATPKLLKSASLVHCCEQKETCGSDAYRTRTRFVLFLAMLKGL
jgi:hypothetical protein